MIKPDEIEEVNTNDMSQAASDLIKLLLLCDRENLEYLRNKYMNKR